MTNATSTTKRARKSSKVQHDAHVAAFNEAQLDAVLAIVATDTGATVETVETVTLDVDAVLTDIANVETVALDTATDETLTLRDRALAYDAATVDAMRERIVASFDRRDTFEGINATDSASSYAKARKNMTANSVAVARAFLALDIEPANVIERKVVENKMFNAKALDKVTEICAFICGNSTRFQKVTQAFIACAMLYSSRNDTAIDNATNKAFLSNSSFKMIADDELRDYLRDYQHKFMSGGKDTQSSQVRNVLDVLNLASIVTVERARGGIVLNDTHEFYSLFHDRYMVRA